MYCEIISEFKESSKPKVHENVDLLLFCKIKPNVNIEREKESVLQLMAIDFENDRSVSFIARDIGTTDEGKKVNIFTQNKFYLFLKTVQWSGREILKIL